MTRGFLKVLLGLSVVLPGVAAAQDRPNASNPGFRGPHTRHMREDGDVFRPRREQRRATAPDAASEPRSSGFRQDTPARAVAQRVSDRRDDRRDRAFRDGTVVRERGDDRQVRIDTMRAGRRDRGLRTGTDPAYLRYGVAGYAGDGDRRGRRADQRRTDGGDRWWQSSRFADRRDAYREQRRFDDRSVWSRGWRNDRRYDWNRYRTSNRGLYNLPRYYAPHGSTYGYGYRRFGIGVTLSSGLFGQDYWLDDPYAYRLPPAYGPYRWVRYFGDALLVDVCSGSVVDAVYGIFD